MLFRRVVFSALLVGTLSGLLLSAVQRWQVVPIIDIAERIEQARTQQAAVSTRGDVQAHDHAGHDHGTHAQPAAGPAGHDHPAGVWEPAEGAERIGFTVLSNVLVGVGFALAMLAVMSAALRRSAVTGGRKAMAKFDWRHGLLWGLAGYAVFFVAPALGLPPEIPGSVAAPLESRQVWWLLTAACTAAGIAVVAFGKSPWRWAGLALIAVPHVIGAPQSGMSPFVGFPAETAAEMAVLAKRFVWASAIANGLFWIVLGSASAWVARRFLKDALA